MLDLLHPRSSQRAARVLSAFLDAVEGMPAELRAQWMCRMAHVYGQLDGQRGLELDRVCAELGLSAQPAGLHDLLFALQIYCVCVSDLTAVAVLQEDPEAWLRATSGLSEPALSAFIEGLSSGRILAAHGVLGASFLSSSWQVSSARAESIAAIRTLCVLLSDAIGPLTRSGPDPMGRFYGALMPRNLLHILGEFYTPPWLAALLLEDLGWQPGQTLLDPFCGSGVFLLAALRQARAAGRSGLEILPALCGIDLNPIACSAARTNLLILLRAEIRASSAPVCLPILCADSLGAAIVRGQPDRAASPSIQLMVDGLVAALPAAHEVDDAELIRQLARVGIRLPRWLRPDPPRAAHPRAGAAVPAMSPRHWVQLAVLRLKPADRLITNPPWVGWEYLSRAYRTYIQPGWSVYGLFTAKGREAAFLKEDISTLALVSVWDRYLETGGRSAVVIRSSTMSSVLASRGMRRLSIFAEGDPLALLAVHQLAGLRVFPSARVEAATWLIEKGRPTRFPVPCTCWRRQTPRWQPEQVASLAAVRAHTLRSVQHVQPLDPTDSTSRWMIGPPACVQASQQLVGACAYQGRTGVFTGGANAVFYLEQIEVPGPAAVGHYRNIIRGARRLAPQVEVSLESELVYEIIRGRDLRHWAIVGHGLLLCPHTARTRMRAISPAIMAERYPRAWQYLGSMQGILNARRGFAGWEKAYHTEAFYALQRIGTYTFAPYKVAWKYIADLFTPAVITPDERGRPRLPNDKVMSVAVEGLDEAHYLCGVLSASPVRWQISASTSGRQISASAIARIRIPRFDPQSSIHTAIAHECAAGHQDRARPDPVDISSRLGRIDALVARLFALPAHAVREFQQGLQQLGGGRH